MASGTSWQLHDNTEISKLFKVIQISLDGTCWLNEPSFVTQGEKVSE